ncbi:MAG TPA: ElyC/SanA/YdcF family protein [Anaerolineae bacterium]|nr:ElyC/SanA/YdcF family protein [Anaerolineae bacterium]
MRNVRVKHIVGAIIVLVMIPTLSILAANIEIVRGGRAGIIQSVDEAPSSQVAIVLGARVLNSGRVSYVLRDRLDTGIDLYRVGKVKKLLLTGDHGRTTYDEANSMRRYVLSKGIPPEDVFMDHAGFNTYDSMYRARDVFEVKDAIVVTQKFHLARSVYTARALGIRAVGIPADKHIYTKALLFDAREVLARTKAFIQLQITNPKPKFLGPKIPITGDGRHTNDKDV